MNIDGPESPKEEVPESSETISELFSGPPNFVKSEPVNRENEGPFDVAEVNTVRPYADFGGIKIVPTEGLNARLDVDESGQTVIAVSFDFEGSTLQVQPFAAPQSAGLWHETRVQIQGQLDAQGAEFEEREGVFGPEIIAEVPFPVAEGVIERRNVRFIGVDGPRWFLRGVISGLALTDPAATEKIEGLFRSIVVVRGSIPMPPRDLLPLRSPVEDAR